MFSTSVKFGKDSLAKPVAGEKRNPALQAKPPDLSRGPEFLG